MKAVKKVKLKQVSLPHGKVMIENVRDPAARAAMRQMNENIASLLEQLGLTNEAVNLAASEGGGEGSGGGGDSLILTVAERSGILMKTKEGVRVYTTSGGGEFSLEAVYV